jgi:DNA-directed RNA polymerase specialized sigma24 family protein
LRPVTPQHSEAMVLAERGLPALQIAERCGISVAEAELVCALARREVMK